MILNIIPSSKVKKNQKFVETKNAQMNIQAYSNLQCQFQFSLESSSISPKWQKNNPSATTRTMPNTIVVIKSVSNAILIFSYKI